MSKKKPQRTHQRVMQVRLTDEQLRAFRRAAAKDERSLSNWVRARLDQASKRELKR